MPDPTASVLALLAGAPQKPLPVRSDELRFANPCHLMVAQAFLSMVTSAEILPAIERAASLADLKALLMADEFFARVADPEHRAAMSALLRSPDASIADMMPILARAWTQAAYFADRPSAIPAADVLHSVAGAAAELGISPARAFEAVAQGRVDAVVCLTDAGLTQLRDDVRQHGRD